MFHPKILSIQFCMLSWNNTHINTDHFKAAKLPIKIRARCENGIFKVLDFICNVPIFSRFLWLAWSVHHHELTVGFEDLSCGVIGFPAAYGVFWLCLRDLLFAVSQTVAFDELS